MGARTGGAKRPLLFRGRQAAGLQRESERRRSEVGAAERLFRDRPQVEERRHGERAFRHGATTRESQRKGVSRQG